MMFECDSPEATPCTVCLQPEKKEKDREDSGKHKRSPQLASANPLSINEHWY